MRNVAYLFILCLLVACSKSKEQKISEEAALVRKHAEKGEPLAQLQLAQRLRTGDGLPKDLPQAVALYRKAAEQGLPNAQHNLGVALDHGQGVAEDDAEAAKWYRRAAEQGLTAAQYSLGLMYANGQGVDKDEKEAIKWFRKAAEQNLPQAQYVLARMLLHGRGIEHDFAAAARWFRIAAQARHVDSIYHLGLMNRDGLGMPADLLLAGKWLILSAKLGKLEAQGAYHMLASELSPVQRKSAELLAEEEQALLSRPAPAPIDLFTHHQGRLIHRDTGKPYTGRVVSNHSNGARAREIELKEGLPDGWEITWFPDDRLAGRTRFKNGLRDGTVEEWYQNGRLRLQGTNQAHRLMQAASFSADGNATGQVKDGNGTLIIHHLNGQRAEEHIFVEGKRNTTHRWDATGKPLN